MTRREALRAFLAGLAAASLAVPVTQRIKFMGTEWIVMVKQPLESEPRVYRFSEPKFIGKAYQIFGDRIYLVRDSSRPGLRPYEVSPDAIG